MDCFSRMVGNTSSLHNFGDPFIIIFFISVFDVGRHVCLGLVGGGMSGFLSECVFRYSTHDVINFIAEYIGEYITGCCFRVNCWKLNFIILLQGVQDYATWFCICICQCLIRMFSLCGVNIVCLE